MDNNNSGNSNDSGELAQVIPMGKYNSAKERSLEELQETLDNGDYLFEDAIKINIKKKAQQAAERKRINERVKRQNKLKPTR